MFGVTVVDADARFDNYRFAHPINLRVGFGRNMAIIGANGSGKSLLADMLTGNIALRQGEVRCEENGAKASSSAIKLMSFRDIYSMIDGRTTYYQQRWNATEVDESPLVRDILKGRSAAELIRCVPMFNIEELLDKRLISLSSGELRKFLIARSLSQNPKMLILDNVFIGLDAASREMLSDTLGSLFKSNGLSIVLLLSNPRDIPNWVDEVLPVANRTCGEVMPASDFMAAEDLHKKLFRVPDGVELPDFQDERQDSFVSDSDVVVEMNHVNVRYPTRHILKDVDWTVRRGEHWALLGENGCGKSTLLSLICGDNPQSYANDITLFGRKRGTGESIWEIKKHIGYLSPDIHTYYCQDIPCLNVVASGYFDTIGLYRQPNENQRKDAMVWMRLFGAENLSSRSFLKISYGEQRLILLIRVFVKNPDLLILDEPLHGLDVGKKRLAKQIIEKYCSQKGRTLIYVTHYKNEIPSCVTLEKVLVKNNN